MIELLVQVHCDEVAGVCRAIMVADYGVDLEGARAAVAPVVLCVLPPPAQHGEQQPQCEHRQHAEAQEDQPVQAMASGWHVGVGMASLGAHWLDSGQRAFIASRHRPGGGSVGRERRRGAALHRAVCPARWPALVVLIAIQGIRVEERLGSRHARGGQAGLPQALHQPAALLVLKVKVILTHGGPPCLPESPARPPGHGGRGRR